MGIIFLMGIVNELLGPIFHSIQNAIIGTDPQINQSMNIKLHHRLNYILGF